MSPKSEVTRGREGKDYMEFNNVFSIISVLSRQPPHLLMLSRKSFFSNQLKMKKEMDFNPYNADIHVNENVFFNFFNVEK